MTPHVRALGPAAATFGPNVPSVNPAPRLALRKEDAARALGVSDESFDRYVRPELPVVRLGTLRLYPVTALQAFLDARAVAPDVELREALA